MRSNVSKSDYQKKQSLCYSRSTPDNAVYHRLTLSHSSRDLPSSPNYLEILKSLPGMGLSQIDSTRQQQIWTTQDCCLSWQPEWEEMNIARHAWYCANFVRTSGRWEGWLDYIIKGQLTYNIATWNCATGLLASNDFLTDKVDDEHDYKGSQTTPTSLLRVWFLQYIPQHHKTRNLRYIPEPGNLWEM